AAARARGRCRRRERGGSLEFFKNLQIREYRSGEGTAVGREGEGRRPSRHGCASGGPSLLLLALLIVLPCAAVSVTKPTPPTHQCSDPCLVAARKARSDCVSSAKGAFTDAFDACVERDVECV